MYGCCLCAPPRRKSKRKSSDGREPNGTGPRNSFSPPRPRPNRLRPHAFLSPFLRYRWWIMKALMFRLWNEDCAAILAAEIMLVASILVIGVVVGLAAVRDSVVTELADVAQALANL